MVCFTPPIARVGSLRSMRIGIATGARALALLAVGIRRGIRSGFVVRTDAAGDDANAGGLGDPALAGADLFHQAGGARAGGVLAGLTIAPLAARYGWTAALGLPIALGLFAAAAPAPARRVFDIDNDPAPIRLPSLFRFVNLRAPFAAVAAAAASWPGVILSEVSRLAPAGRIADAAAGSTTISFLGYVVGPLAFSVLVRWSGGWLVPYLAVAAQIGAMAAGAMLWAARYRCPPPDPVRREP